MSEAIRGQKAKEKQKLCMNESNFYAHELMVYENNLVKGEGGGKHSFLGFSSLSSELVHSPQ
jgi:hypothetical protein